MLSRAVRIHFSSLAKDLNSKMAEVQSRLKQTIPSSLLSGTPYLIPGESRQKTMDEKLADLDKNVATIEGLREAGRPEEIRIKDLPMKYGRTGRHPAYPWYGEQVPHEDRVPYLADRLGKYSDLAPVQTDIHDWLQVKSDLHNPLFHSFFVQEPTQEPDPDVDFDKGEIIYENPDALKGAALANQTGYLSILYTAFFIMHTAFTGRTVYPIADEGMDHRTDGYNSGQTYLTNIYAFTGDWADFESLSAHAFIMPIAPLAAVTAVGFVQTLTSGVCTRMQFNKNRDLIFVTKVGGVLFPKEYEEVYETTHLQVLPPSPGSGFEIVSERKIFTINCMNSHESFRVCSDKSYWNPDLQLSFFNHLHSLWS